MIKPNAGAPIVSCLRYREPDAAITWLCQVFGFDRHLVVPGANGTAEHAELSFGSGMIMIGSVKSGGVYDSLVKHPDDIGGFETQTVYLIVADADTVYTTAKAAGATILIDIKDEDYGGRSFTCRDPEGHIWTVGTYNPWAGSQHGA